MIIREMQMRNKKNESLHNLVQYMEEGRDGLHPAERVQEKWTCNCKNADPVLAESEILSIARRNTRTKLQKYAHIVISPAPGEKLGSAEWHEAAEALARKLGLSSHQYFCYVHKDTDQEHLHFIANLIDPRTYARDHLSWSRKREQELAQELEEKFSLRRIDHSARNTREQAEARDMERKSGQQSFLGYCMLFKAELEAAKNWQDFHSALARHGVRARLLPGRGLRLEACGAGRPAAQKASALDKGFSFARLEERFGPWEEPAAEVAAQPPRERYEARPVDYGGGKAEREELAQLFGAYQDDQKARMSACKSLMEAERLREQADEARLAHLKAEAEEAAKAAAEGTRAARQAALAEVRRKWRAERRRIRMEAAARRKRIRKETASCSFQDWLRRLRDPAEADPARDVLSTREGAFGLEEQNGIMGIQILVRITVAEAGFFTLRKRTGKGQDIFTSPMSRGDMIRDLGYRITCNDKPSLITVMSLLELGRRRYGDKPPLRVFGTAQFQRQAAIAASEAGISIACDDRKAQEFYEGLKEDVYEQQRKERRIRELAGLAAGWAGMGGGIGSFAAAATFSAAASFDYGRGSGRSGGKPAGSGRAASGHRGAGIAGPDRAGKGGRSAPVGSEGSMPPVQGRDLDEDRQRGGVLLHDHAPEGLGKHGLDELHGAVRREVPGREKGAGRGGEGDAAGLRERLAAVRAYVRERNGKRAMGIRGIPEHAEWSGEAGLFTFQGFRTLGIAADCLLLEKEGKIYIKISSKYEKNRLSRLGRGTHVDVSASGRVAVARRRSAGAALERGAGRNGR